MRQIGNLDRRTDAERFAAYLVTAGVAAHAEEDGDGWAIWVRDENQVDQARDALSDFQDNPLDARYQGVERRAHELLKGEQLQREQVGKNVIHMRGRWRGPGGPTRRRPLVITCIVLSVLVYLTTSGGANRLGTVLRTLLFVDPIHLLDDSWNANLTADRLVDIRQGEIWRVVTPIFIHFGTMHIAFNMIMFYQLGSIVEDRRGTGWMGLFVLACGAISNLFQCLVPIEWGGSVMVGGMSGVLYGLFGFMWMKSRFQPEMGIFMNGSTVAVLLGWMLLGMSGVMERAFGLHMANWAHGIGLAVGIAVGYLPLLLPSSGGR